MQSRFELTQIDRYRLLSLLTLLSIPVACLIAYFIIGVGYALTKAVGILIVPLSLFCWIFTTIRAIHLVNVKFWRIPSTYVALIGGAIAFVVCLATFLYTEDAARRGHQVSDLSFYVAAALLYCGCLVWSFLYNWRKTGSAMLAASLTILQSVSAGAVLALLNLWLGGRSTQKYKDEHRID